MKKYDELSDSLKNEIIEVCKEDEYGLRPEFLYKNIFGSTGEVRTLAKMFVVSESLILQIREEGNNCKPKSYLNLLKVIQIKKYFDI